MLALHGRKALLAALLATALSVPASANDGVNTAQQTSVGQVATEVAALQASPTVVGETYATETNGRIAPTTRPRAKVMDERQPASVVVRQPMASASYYRAPLILGIGY